MSIKDKFKSLFRDAPAQPSEPPQGETAWATPLLSYSSKDFPKYNPDALLRNKGFGVYKKMQQDDQVKAVCQFKRNAIIARKYLFDVEIDENGQEIPEQRVMADYFDFMLDSIQGSFKDAMNGILTGLPSGFSITEKVYGTIEWEGKQMWCVKKMKLRPFDTFEFEVDEHGNIVKLVQLQGSDRKQIPMNKVVHFVHQPDVDEHYGGSDLRACYRNWWSKDIIIKFMNIHLERHAGGFVYAKVDGNLGPNEKANLERMMQNITASTSAIVPQSVELDKIMPTNTDSYEKAIVLHNLAIARSQLVPNLLGLSDQKNVGSFAQSQTQMESFFWILSAIAVRLEEVLNEQLFRELALWNFGTTDFPRFKFEPISDLMKLDIALAWSELVKGGAVTKTDTDEAHIRMMMNFPEKGEPDEEQGQVTDKDTPGTEDDELEKKFQERPWLKRVDFQELGRIWESHDKAMMEEMSDVMAIIKVDIDNQVIKIVGDKSLGNVDVKQTDIIAIKPTHLTMLRKTIRGNLKSGLNAAHDDAQADAPQKFAELIPQGMDMIQADKFLSRATLTITDVIDAEVLADVKNVLSNGITYDWTLRDTIKAMENHTRLASLLPQVDAAGRAINVPHRLENIARTNMSRAWNQGRTAYFNRSSVRKHIQAFEYSAILDQRTTDICERLDGRIIKQFDHYAPPNHFMCRSILVPVFDFDGWDGKQDKFPAIQPHNGFGGEVT